MMTSSKDKISSKRMKLQLRISDDDDHATTSFCRLLPQTARELHRQALENRIPIGNNDETNVWSIQKIAGSGAASTSSGVEFLPLEIRLLTTTRCSTSTDATTTTATDGDNHDNSQIIVYASYNGGDFVLDSVSSTIGDLDGTLVSDLPILQVPRHFYASSFVVEQHKTPSPPSLIDVINNSEVVSLLQVRALPYVRKASRVWVEPLTVEDWEQLELSCEWLEAGGLLGQVSLVFCNQILSVALKSSSSKNNNNSQGAPSKRVRLRVQPRTFDDENDDCCTEEQSDGPLWPPMRDTATGPTLFSTVSPASPRCRLLVADTRIIVEPKPRRQPVLRHELKLVACGGLEYGPAMRALAQHLDSSTNDDSMDHYASSTSALLDVTVPLNAVAMHPQTLKRLESCSAEADSEEESQTSGHVGLDNHADSTGSGNINLKDATASDNGVLARIFRLPSRTDGDENDPLYVSVITSRSVPKGHVALHPSNRICLGLDLFADIVKVELVEPIDIQSALLNTVEALQNADVVAVTCAPVSCNHPISHTTSILEGLRVDVVGDEEDNCILGNGSLVYLKGPSNTNGLFRVNTTLGKKMSQPMLLRRSTLVLYGQQTRSENQAETTAYEDKTRSLVNLLPDVSVLLSTLPNRFPLTASGSCGVVLTGETGSGKTHTALYLAAIARLRFGHSVYYIDCRELRDRTNRMLDILKALDQLFADADAAVRSVVVLDNADVLMPHSTTYQQDSSSLQGIQVNPQAVEQSHLVRTHLESLIGLSQSDICLVLTSSIDTIAFPEEMLSTSNGVQIKLPCMNGTERETMFRRVLQQSENFDQSTFHEAAFSRNSDGYRPFDIKRLATRVIRRLRTELSKNAKNAFKDECKRYLPISRSSADDSNTETNQNWSDVGGLFEAKEELLSTVLRPSVYARIFEKSAIKLARGMLLFGPPGCGKTYIVPALSKKCGLPLIMCRGPELLDKYIGASEAKVRELFARAASAAPAILFLDEIDSLAPRRGSDQTGVTDRIVNQLLTFLDGVEDVSQGGNVYVIASSSRPDRIDPALLRPGRLEKHIYVGHSESNDECADLFATLCQYYCFDSETTKLLEERNLHTAIMKQTDHVKLRSPADLAAVLGSAQLNAVRESVATGLGDQSQVFISKRDLQSAFRDFKPSTSHGELQSWERTYIPFRKRNNSKFEGRVAPPSDQRTALR